MSDADRFVGTVVADRYQLTRLLGQGGFGFVYEATHVKLGKRFAIKFLHRQHEVDAQFVKRFEREAQVTARLDHPNIVDVSDFGEDASLGRYIVMEFLEGESLYQRIRSGGPMSSAEAVRHMRPIVDAFAFAHEHGVVHRDVKSANIMLVQTEAVQNLPKILDFGIARLIENASQEEAEKLTRSGVMMGSLSYMSPEQAQGQNVDARSDLYSLGIVLYEMITGRVPFKADSTLGLLMKLVNEAPIPPSQVPDLHVHPYVEMIILRCLQKAPERRYPDARALAAALAEAARMIDQGLEVPPDVMLTTQSLTRDMLADGSLRAAATPLEPAAGGASAPTKMPTRPPAPSPLTLALDAPKARTESPRRLVLLAALLLATAGAAWMYVGLRPERQAPPAHPASSSPAAPITTVAEPAAPTPAPAAPDPAPPRTATAPTAPAPAPGPVPVVVGSDPAEARVRWKESMVALGTTPLLVNLGSEMQGRVLVVEKEGFEVAEWSVDTERARADGKILLRLTPRAATPADQPEARRPESKPKATKSAPSTPKKKEEPWNEI